MGPPLSHGRLHYTPQSLRITAQTQRLSAATALLCRLHPHTLPSQVTFLLVPISFPNGKANSVCSCCPFSTAQTLTSVRFPTRAPEERVQTQKVPSHASPVGQDLESQRMDINVKVRLSCVHRLRICVWVCVCGSRRCRLDHISYLTSLSHHRTLIQYMHTPPLPFTCHYTLPHTCTHTHTHTHVCLYMCLSLNV